MNKNINTNLKKILIFIIAMLSTFGMNININKNVPFMDSFNGNDYIYIIILLVYIYFINKVASKKEDNQKRKNSIVLCISIILTAFEIVGKSIYNYTDLSGIFYSKAVFIKNVLKSIYVFVTLYLSLNMLYSFINCDKEEYYFKNIKNKKTLLITFLCIWAVIFIAYIPFFLTYYPRSIVI